jgi:bile acid:Na+ symporter, BASS family
VPGVVIAHWVALPIIGGLVGKLFALSDAVTGGVLLVAAASAAPLSCFYAQLAAGDLALAITLAAVSNALAFLTTPLVAAVGFHLFLGSSGRFDLPLASAAQRTLVGLLLPLLAGMLIRHRLGEQLDRWLAPVRAIGLAAIVSVLAAVVIDEYTTIRARSRVCYKRPSSSLWPAWPLEPPSRRSPRRTRATAKRCPGRSRHAMSRWRC